jgi:hypothetical protein
MPSLHSASSSHVDRGPWSRAHRARVGVAVAVTLLLNARHGGTEPASLADALTGDPPEQRQSDSRGLASKTILLVRTAGDDAVMSHVRAELRAYGWRIIELGRQDGSVLRDSLATLASEQAAMAAVRVDPQVGQIEIHIGRTWGNVDEILRGEEEGPLDGRLLALRATEALRAHGLDLGPTAAPASRNANSNAATGPAPRDAEPPRPAAVRRENRVPNVPAPKQQASETLPASTKGLWLQLAPAAIGSPGGLGLGLAGWVGARLELSTWWSIAVMGLVPITSHAVTEDQGSARVASSAIGIAVEGALLRRSFGSVAAGLGAAELFTMTQGQQAQPGYSTASDPVNTMAVHTYLRVGLRLGPNWNLFGTLLGGMSFPEVSIAFTDRVVRTWGQPYAMLALGMEARTVGW